MKNPFDDEEDNFSWNNESSDSNDPWGETTTDPWAEDSNSPAATDKSGKLPGGFPMPPKPALIAVAVLALVIAGASIIPNLLPKNSIALPSATPTVSKSVTPSPTETVDMYSQPKSLQQLIDIAHQSTVIVYCQNPNLDTWSSGSGWAISLSDDANTTEDDAYPTEIITNHHVIEDCVGGDWITIQMAGETTVFRALLWTYDVKNDLAVLLTELPLPSLPLVTSSHKPEIGHWVMAVGSPGGTEGILEGSVTTGHVSNIQPKTVVTDAAVNQGNSGGPLINVYGEVVGTNTFGIVGGDNITYAYKVEMICTGSMDCKGKSL